MVDQGTLSAARHFCCKFSRKSSVVRCPCAFRLRRLAQDEGRGVGLGHCLCKFLHKRLLLRCPCVFRVRSSGMLVGGSCISILFDPFQQQRSFSYDLVIFLSGSWHEDLDQGLLQFRVRGSHRDPGEILSEALLDLVQVLLRRSCFSAPQEVIAFRSCWRCSALVLVWTFLVGCSWAVFAWRSSEILYIEGLSLTILLHSLRCPGLRF